MSLSSLDYVIIVASLAAFIVAGLLVSRLASKNLEHYFLGGRNLPWYLLGVLGVTSWFDLTGTMIITSFLYLLGPQGLYIEFRGGAVLTLAFALAYTAKWHRRSGCMTVAEWATYRFGTGVSGEFLRFISALWAVFFAIVGFGYMIRGSVLFMGTVFPFDPIWMTAIILGLAAIYTVFSGFYGAVLTDLLHGVIMLAGCLVIGTMAWRSIHDISSFNAIAGRVTGNYLWTSSAPAWEITVPPGYEAYHSLILAAFFFFIRNILAGLGTGGDQRYFAARNPREASQQSLVAEFGIMFRWPLMISFAILGIVLVSRILPDHEAVRQASEAVRQLCPNVSDASWHQTVNALIRHPENMPPATVQTLSRLLGPGWQSSMLLVGPHGTVDPEIVLPAVIMHSFGSGMRGLIIVTLLAAMTGSFTNNVNSSAAFFVRDIYQNFLRPKAGNRELIWMSYFFSFMVIVLGFVMGLRSPNINDIFTWIIMGLGAGSLGPSFLRLYWWRANAWGMSIGTLVGGATALLQRALYPQLSEWSEFVWIGAISIGTSIVASLLTAPTPEKTIRYFYQTTRPFGLWKPFWKELPEATRRAWAREHRNDIITVGCTLVWQISLFLLPMQFITHNGTGFFVTLPFFVAGSVALYFFWWKNLPSSEERIADFVSTASGEESLGEEEKHPVAT